MKEWKAEAKARYLASLIESENLDFREAARKTGSTTPAVRRSVEAYAILRQAIGKGFDAEPARHYFGIFYNALQDPGIREYLGLPEAAGVKRPRQNPVRQDNTQRLRALLAFLFGDDAGPKVIRESRQIRDLGRVLPNATAREVLADTRDLAMAVRAAGGDQEGIRSELTQARLNLLAANGEAFKFRKNKKVRDLALEVRKVLNELLKNLGT